MTAKRKLTVGALYITGLLMSLVLFQNFTTINESKNLNVYTYALNFYLDPNFITSENTEEDVKKNLGFYVEKINQIFLASGIRLKFSYDSKINFYIASNQLLNQNGGIPTHLGTNIPLEMKKDDFNLIIKKGARDGQSYAIRSAKIVTENIFSEVKSNSSIANRKYFGDQLSVIAHEFGHTLMLGHTEYYNIYKLDHLSKITGKFFDLETLYADDYWLARSEILNDPMKGRDDFHTTEITKNIKFSKHSVDLANIYLDVISKNINVKPPLPSGLTYVNPNFIHSFHLNISDLKVAIKIQNQNNETLKNCKIDVYNPDFSKVGKLDTLDTANGVVEYNLANKLDSGSSKKNILYFITDCPGYRQGRNAISYFDIQAFAFLKGGSANNFYFDGNLVIKVNPSDSCVIYTANSENRTFNRIDVKNGDTVDSFMQRPMDFTKSCSDSKIVRKCINGTFDIDNAFQSCPNLIKKRLKFYVSKDFLSVMSHQQVVDSLKNYVAGINKIYEKTNLEIVFDSSLIFFTDTLKVPNGSMKTFIGSDFDFAVQITKPVKPVKILSPVFAENNQNELWIGSLALSKLILPTENDLNAVNQRKEHIRMLRLAIDFKLGLSDSDNTKRFVDKTNMLPDLSFNQNNIVPDSYWDLRKDVNNPYEHNSQSAYLLYGNLNSSVNGVRLINELSTKSNSIKNNEFEVVLRKNTSSSCEVKMLDQSGKIISSNTVLAGDISSSIKFTGDMIFDYLDGDLWPNASGKNSFIAIKSNCSNGKVCGLLLSYYDFLFDGGAKSNQNAKNLYGVKKFKRNELNCQ